MLGINEEAYFSPSLSAEGVKREMVRNYEPGERF